MTSGANQYIRQVLRQTEPPPAAKARFFYTSPIPIDDPLSPLPPPTTASASTKRPPKAFSEYDNAALDKAWHELRQRILRHNKEQSEKAASQSRSRAGSATTHDDRPRSGSRPSTSQSRQIKRPSNLSQVDGPLDGTDSPLEAFGEATQAPDTTGNPFVRAPSRKQLPARSREELQTRPKIRTHDTYQWDDASHLVDSSPATFESSSAREDANLSAKVAVGSSRLHQVEMPNLQMTPIYWTPVHDEAIVVRATWFYQDTMLPIETDVANMLEAGYVDLQVWTETWRDELNSVRISGIIPLHMLSTTQSRNQSTSIHNPPWQLLTI
jgi:hypothetical protein